MTNIPDEKILEFCRAEEVWAWNEYKNEAKPGKPGSLILGSARPFFVHFEKSDAEDFANFSLTKPQVYEDGKWYTATIKNPKTVLPKELKRVFLYNDGIFETLSIRARDVAEFKEHQLTNIRPIPEEMWDDLDKSFFTPVGDD